MANKVLGAKGLTGNTGFSLDSIPSNLIKTGDFCVVSHPSSQGGDDKIYFYTYTQNTNKESNPPSVIIPYDSIDNEIYGTWETLSPHIAQVLCDYIYDQIKLNIFAKSFIIEDTDWNYSNITGIYYYNITHNLNETHPIISTWDMFTNRLVNVNILSISEDSIRIETTKAFNLKVKILK